MKKALVFLFTLFISIGVHAQTEALTNQSILDMKELGFSEDVIITKIKNSACDFDSDISALKSLKEQGISDNIIITMLNSYKSNNYANNNEIKNEPERKLGIFINEDRELKRVLPSVFSGTKTNTLGSALSYGLASSSIRTILNNSESINIAHNTHPEFIFFFARQDDQSYINNGSNWWFFSASSPNEFLLVKLDQKRKTRELMTGSVNIYAGTNIGIDENSVIPFEIINIDDYTFKVTPVDPLSPGEYCFFYKGGIPQGGYNNQSVFDFSVQANEALSKYQIGYTVWVLYKGKPKRCDIAEIERKKDGIYYVLYPHFSGKTLKLHESKCHSSEQDLLESLRTEAIEKDNVAKSKRENYGDDTYF